MVRVFYSYSHEDADALLLLASHLKGLSRQLIEPWDDHQIRMGDPWNTLISDHLDHADLVIALMSPAYMASDFCGLELDRAMERYQAGKTRILIVMLSAYNLSGSGYEILQTFPPLDKPISAWPDKNAAFAAVSREVEKLARAMDGGLPRNKLLHRNREELGRLLYHVCDRVPQRDALVSAMQSRKDKPRRPFVIVMHGIRQDAHDWFLDRLANRLIKEWTGSPAGRLTPLEWPEYSSRKTPMEIFGPRLSASFPVDPLAETTDWNAAIKQCIPVTLLPCTVAAADWGKHGNKLFDAFLQLWEQWPDLPEGRMLLAVVSIKYEAGAEELNEKIAAYLERVRLESRPGFIGRLLPRFEKIRRTHMENWINTPEVAKLFDSPERAITRLEIIFDREPAIPIQPLGDVHFPRFLEAL